MEQAASSPRDHATQIEVARLGYNLGGGVSGVDLSQSLDSGSIQAINHALLENEVLVFRDQDITQDQFMEFGRAFGELTVSPFSPNSEDRPELIILDNHRDNPPKLTDNWHSDETFRETPPKATMLRAVISPKIGGDTMFASMTAAYAGLGDQTQRLIGDLRFLVDFTPFRRVFGNDADSQHKLREIEKEHPIRSHPMVRVHPESGRKSLFVNSQFAIGIEGMKDSESRPLLEMLYAQARIPEYQFRVQWQPNTLVFWDNRAVLHYAIHDYYPQRRIMERVTIKGDVPVGLDVAYTGAHIPRREIELGENDAPPTSGDSSVRIFERSS
ncbi:MAG: TauD/TfdA family dioxygenase [Alphaproteobacteria bacterium]|nr:TauD/TfdA family dioxygenase [Alphaproteobacteria bacterium]